MAHVYVILDYISWLAIKFQNLVVVNEVWYQDFELIEKVNDLLRWTR